MAIRRALSTLAAILCAALCSAAPITVKSLLAEMADLDRLTMRPSPSYTCAQSSSYDRASKSPDIDWFANGDAGKFLGIESVQGRKEYVMAALRGPGAVVRVWSANPAGVIRFYFDGESIPRLEAPMGDLLSGKVAPFSDPFAYFSARGANLYFPIPYAKALKITVDDSGGDGARHLYYHVGFRTYAAGTEVESFAGAALDPLTARITELGQALLNPDTRPTRRIVRARIDRSERVAPNGAAKLFDMEGSGAVYEFRVRLTVPGSPADSSSLPWNSPLQLHRALRETRLEASFDVERCIDAPLGDFFGTAPGINPYQTFPMEVRKDGWMICRFFMPFGRNASIRAVNGSQTDIRLEWQITVVAYRFGASSYHFHSQWIGEKTRTRPMRDAGFLNVVGEGIWAGSSLHVANPTGAWWGEGDEKAYVDGEAFPSTFGTGTEDYYGYAWCDPTPFVRPYHSQPRCDGPGNRGHTNVNRWHVFDPIPYRKSLRFDIELWHWAEVEVDFDRTAYWYAKPGGTAPARILAGSLPITEIAKPAPIKGAIEGEGLEVVSRSGGELEKQGGFADLSSETQLWWRDMKEGDSLMLRVPTPGGGRYELVGRFCLNRDYGIHELSFLGTRKRMDFFSDGLKWEVVSFGAIDVPEGNFEVTVKSAGHRQGAIPRNMFAIDYLMLKNL